MVENDCWSSESVAILKELFPLTGKAFVVGITGSPGAGKSTLVDQLAKHYREKGLRVGVLAVDPTSPFSGGAVLGDRIRMHSLGTDPGVFIRSMATRGQLGGLSPSIHEAILILDAAGYEIILIETVGVGQDEVDIVKTAHASLVLMVPGMGDDIQTIKAGIMEIGDVFVINKADRAGVDRTERELHGLLSIAHRADGWNPPVVRTVAPKGEGIGELANAIAAFRDFRASSPQRANQEILFYRDRLLEMLADRSTRRIVGALGLSTLDECAERVRARKSDPYSLIEEMLDKLGWKEPVR